MSAINIARRLTEVITVKRQTGHTSAGDAVFGAAFTMTARIERSAANEADAEGRKLSRADTVITLAELRDGDRVWLPESNTADVNQSQPVASSEKRVALDGTVTHWVTVLG